jgi:Putative Ig domain
MRCAGTNTRLTWRYVHCVVAVLLASCGGGSGGSGSAPPAAPTDLSYSQPPAFVVGKAISPLTPTVMGLVTSYSVAPSLPDGLSLNASSGAISGTPTAVAAISNYTVTASNAAGSTPAAVAIAVDAAAPSISYTAGNFILTVSVPVQGLTPSNGGGAALSWSINPALPAGLSFSAATGVISGTPTAIAAPVTYTVTAQNSGGQGTASLTLSVQSVLLDLGHAQTIDLLRLTNSRVVSMDHSRSWILWNYATATKLTGGLAVCRSSDCVAGTLPPVDMEGPTLVDETAAGLEVRASSDGSVLAVIPTPIVWWKLASDGSYLCTGSASALSVWSTTGGLIATRAGDYSTAVAFAAAGEVRIALGPAGANVVETVALPSGTSAVSPAFQGTFNSWFLDGQHFLSNTGNTVWTYTNAGVQADLTALPTVENLTGQGGWFWTYSSTTNSQVNIYKVGASGSPTTTYSPGVIASVIPSGLTLGILTFGTGAGSVLDLSGSTISTQNFTAPVAYTVAFAGTSGSQWLVGNRWGVLVDGTSIGGTQRYFGYGAAWSIAGSSTVVAVATASGTILYFNAATNAREGTINFMSSQLALSTDGSVMAAAGDQNDAQYHDDESINTYSLPSGAKIQGWPYSFARFSQNMSSLPFEISLSGSGTALSQVLGTFNGAWSCTRQVTAVTGGPVLWSDSVSATPSCTGVHTRLSPNGAEVAVSDAISATTGTNIYNNGTLTTAVPGWAVGWLDDSRILVNSYLGNNQGHPAFSGSTIYNSAGSKIAAPPLPELQSLQVVNTDTVYNMASNAIYSTTTGIATWTSASPATGVGAVAGPNVVFASGNQVLVQPF